MPYIFTAVCLSAHAQPAGVAPSGETRAQYLPGSTIETLLNSGYEIKAASGPLVFLVRPAAEGKAAAGVACTFDITNGMLEDPTSVKAVRSGCFRLN